MDQRAWNLLNHLQKVLSKLMFQSHRGDRRKIES